MQLLLRESVKFIVWKKIRLYFLASVSDLRPSMNHYQQEQNRFGSKKTLIYHCTNPWQHVARRTARTHERV